MTTAAQAALGVAYAVAVALIAWAALRDCDRAEELATPEAWQAGRERLERLALERRRQIQETPPDAGDVSTGHSLEETGRQAAGRESIGASRAVMIRRASPITRRNDTTILEETQ